MSYTPPDHQSVDFNLDTYSPPDHQSVDFELSPGSVIAATPSTISATSPSPTLSSAGVSTISAVSSDITTQTPSPSVVPGSVSISSPVSVFSSSTPIPNVDATGNVSISPSESVLNATSPSARIGYKEWTIGAKQFGDLLEETREWDNLELTFRTDASTISNNLQGLKNNAGKLDVVQDSDGGFTTVDRIGGNNTFTIKSPITRRDVRYKTTWHSEDFEQEVIDQVGDKLEIQIELIPDDNKTVQSSYGTVTKASDEWKFEMDAGEFATTRVTSEKEAESEMTIDKETITAILEPRSVRILEESLRGMAATNIREVPDGDNLTEDNSSNNVNTVTVTEATDGSDILASGTYVVEDYETQWLNNTFYQVTLSLLKK